MAIKIPDPLARVKCELEGDAHTRKLRFARAIGACTFGRRAAIGARLHRSASLLQAWAEPERANVPPNQALAEVVLSALLEGQPAHEALEPILDLNDLFGLAATPQVEILGTVGVAHASAAALRECAEVVSKVTEYAADGLDGFDLVRLLEQSREARAALDQLDADVEAAVRRRQQHAS